jgi:hypothetical protein
VQEVVGQNFREQPGLIGCEAAATGLFLAERVLHIFDSVHRVTASVVNLDHIRASELGVIQLGPLARV